jgi:phosphatidylglycerol:prolipoprotein diacylglycerol transferase
MINYEPVPILFRAGSIELRSYGLALIIAFLIGFVLARKEVQRKSLDIDTFINISLLITVGAFIGSRSLHVMEQMDYYRVNVSEILKIWKGGASSLGGFIGGVIFPLMYVKKREIHFWNYADAFVPSICIGIFITRIGCFLNWDDYGVASNLPWAVNAGDFPRHPTQLYLSANGLILFLGCYRMRIICKESGKLFLLCAVTYSSVRFFIEFLRDDFRYALNLTLAQLISIVIILTILVYFKLTRFAQE